VAVINMHEARTNLSQLVRRAAAGEEIVIAKDGEPMARLTPLPSMTQTPRVSGDLKGGIWEAPDCWDRDEELEAAFGESILFPTERSAE